MDTDAVTVALFTNEREANARSCVAMIEDVLRELGHNPDTSRLQSARTEPTWGVTRGSARVAISLINRADYVHLRVVAPILTIDAGVDVPRLHAHLLALNARDIAGAAFATAGQEVQLVSERSTIDLDRSEVKDLIDRVSRYADEWDNKLVEEFGGTLGRA